LLLALACAPAAFGVRTLDPGTLPQTTVLPSLSSHVFHARIDALWRGIVSDSLQRALPAFFPRAAYLQVKQIPDAGADYDERLLGNFRLDIRAAHALLGTTPARSKVIRVDVPRVWAWIPPGYCDNRIGYWHAPGARLVYEEDGRVGSFGIFSFISWRGQWYVVHLAVWNEPGTIDDPEPGPGHPGPPGGC